MANGNAVRAKFRVTSNEKMADGTSSIVLYPVMASDGPAPENAIFGSATPSGRIEMVIHTPEVAAQFVVGSFKYADFTDAEA